jgi:hypothetical protein
MLNWNEIISGLALALAGFAYATFFYVVLPVRYYDSGISVWAIGIAIALYCFVAFWEMGC